MRPYLIDSAPAMKVEITIAMYKLHCNNPSFHGDSSMSHATCCVIIPEERTDVYQASTVYTCIIQARSGGFKTRDTISYSLVCLNCKLKL